MILIIDNYDSFVYTLARYAKKFTKGKEDVRVVRNDKITLKEIETISPDIRAIILSPGPCAPAQAGICTELVRHFGANIPILGVCLGHQSIGEAYGGKTIRAPKPVHGKASIIEHDASTPLFHNLPPNIEGGRYHSLITDISECYTFEVNAVLQENKRIIMAMRHKIHPVFGLQFHPESILTPDGYDILGNFLTFAHDWRVAQK